VSPQGIGGSGGSGGSGAVVFPPDPPTTPYVCDADMFLLLLLDVVVCVVSPARDGCLVNAAFSGPPPPLSLLSPPPPCVSSLPPPLSLLSPLSHHSHLSHLHLSAPRTPPPFALPCFSSRTSVGSWLASLVTSFGTCRV
jgi:hypothetical protein